VQITDAYGEKLSKRLSLKLEKSELSGTIFRDEGAALKSTLKGQELHFSFKESGGDQNEYQGRITGDTLTGEYTVLGATGDQEDRNVGVIAKISKKALAAVKVAATTK
jgi:hypothetical protein